MTRRPRIHWPSHATGPAAWSPWVTLCGLRVRATADETESRLTYVPEEVTCRSCQRTEAWRKLP